MSFLSKAIFDKRSGISDYSTMNGNVSPWLKNLFSGFSNASGKEVTPQTAKTIAAVYRAVDLRANVKAMLPLCLRRYKKKGLGSELVEDHPLSNIFDIAFNEHMTTFTARHSLSQHRDLRGNAFMGIARDGRGITGLYPIAPERLLRFWITPENKRMYEIANTGTGAPIMVPQESMCHMLGPSWDGLYGQSIISHASQSLGGMMGQEEHISAQWANGARIAAVLKHPGIMDPEAYDRLEKDFKEKYSGSANAFKTMLLEDGVSLEKVSMTPEDMQMIETKKAMVPDVSRWFNVPEPMLYGEGIASQEVLQLFLRFGVIPELVSSEKQLNKDLLTPAERKQGYYIKYDDDELRRGDIKTEVDRATRFVQWGIQNRDEVREEMDMNPLPDGLGEKFMSPLNMVPLGEDPAPDSPPDPMEGQQAPPQPSNNPADNVTIDPADAGKKAKKRAVSASFRRVFDEKMGQILAKEANFVEKRQEKFAKDQNNPDYLTKCSEFYKDHPSWMESQLAPIAMAYCELADGDFSESAMKRHLKTFTDDHCTRSMRQATEANDHIGNWRGNRIEHSATLLLEALDRSLSDET